MPEFTHELCEYKDTQTVIVKKETEESYENYETEVFIKQETAACKNETELCVKKEASAFIEREEDHMEMSVLYPYQIKEELELGPVLLHQPCVVSVLPEGFSQSCSVMLERMLINEDQTKCQIGMHTYTLRHDPPHKAVSNSYQCNDCGKAFRKKIILRKHILTHSPKRFYKTGNNYNSIQMEKVFHWTMQGEKKFKCNYCNFKCNDKSNLHRHQIRHCKEKPFACSQCDFRCITKYNLKTHYITHTGLKPYACNQCDYTCIRKDRLRIHMMTHSEKPVKTEKRFLCNVCEYKSSRKADLIIHQRTHTCERPFKCSYCDLKFSQKTHLRSHQMLHTGHKPFLCSSCGYKCFRKTHLRSHMLLRHKLDII